MKYRDNDVYFTCNVAGMSIVGGSYTIGSFFVTSGQDPQKKITEGKVFQMNNSQRLRFSVGRKGTNAVANWFNERVPAPYTTFGHGAGKLNFAFIGSLILRFSDGSVYTFNNISLAQGHSGASNNWWFGGETCINIGSNKVDTIGKDTSGKNGKFVFRRGGSGNGVNKITITQIRKQYNNNGRYTNWMGQLDDNLLLSALTIPGTHDSGTKNASSTFGARCQNFDIEQQLKDGIRFLDIRLENNGDMLDLCHGSVSCNVSFGQVLVRCRDFLEANPGETILMSVKKDAGRRDIAQNFQNYVNGVANYFLRTFTMPTLGKARGKIVLLRRFPYSKFGVDWHGADGNLWPDNKEFYITTFGQKFRIFDKYKLSDTNKKKEQLITILNDANRTDDADNEKMFYVIFASIALHLTLFVNYNVPQISYSELRQKN